MRRTRSAPDDSNPIGYILLILLGVSLFFPPALIAFFILWTVNFNQENR